MDLYVQMSVRSGIYPVMQTTLSQIQCTSIINVRAISMFGMFEQGHETVGKMTSV